MRKEPIQDRSQARLDRILEEAEKLILEHGLLGLSIREVARRADTNIATFYQFFPNRGSLTRRIVEIYHAKLQAALSDALQAADGRDLVQALEDVQAKMVRFYLAHPITLDIWPGIHADPDLRALDREDTKQNAAQLAAYLKAQRPRAPCKQIEDAAEAIVLTAGPVFRHAVQEPPARRKRILAAHMAMVARLVEGF